MKNFFIAILILLVLGLGGYLVYDKVILNDEDEEIVENCEKEEIAENEKEEVTYSYSEIAGAYYVLVDRDIEDMSNASVGYTLYLWENGTFNYGFAMNAQGTICGNYVIEGNKIILNYLYETNMGTGLFHKEGVGSLEIIDKDTIVDNDNLHGTENITEKIELKRTNDSNILNNQENYNLNTLIEKNETEE